MSDSVELNRCIYCDEFVKPTERLYSVNSRAAFALPGVSWQIYCPFCTEKEMKFQGFNPDFSIIETQEDFCF